MTFISEYNSITCTGVVGKTKEEEKSLRDSEEVRYSIRNAKKAEMKKRNYYRLVNGRPAGGEVNGYRNSEMLEESGFFLLDFDAKKGSGGYRKVWEKMKPHLKRWGVVHFEKSARGGAHLTVVRTEGLTIEENIRLFELRTDLEFDHSCKDLARACFLVPNEHVLYEDEVYYSDEKPQPLPLSEEDRERLTKDQKELEEKHRAEVEKRRLSAPELKVSDYSDEAELLEELAEIICKQKVDLTHTYERWIYLGFIIANVKGAAGLKLYQRLSSFYPLYDPRETARQYENLLRTTRREVGIGTLIMMAREEGVIA